jgi:hypothetical protein
LILSIILDLRFKLNHFKDNNGILNYYAGIVTDITMLFKNEFIKLQNNIKLSKNPNISFDELNSDNDFEITTQNSNNSDNKDDDIFISQQTVEENEYIAYLKELVISDKKYNFLTYWAQNTL